MPPVKIEKEPNTRLLLLEVLGCLIYLLQRGVVCSQLSMF